MTMVCQDNLENCNFSKERKFESFLTPYIFLVPDLDESRVSKIKRKAIVSLNLQVATQLLFLKVFAATPSLRSSVE